MIVFLTVYLGLIAGRQPFELQVDPGVRTVRLLLDGNEVATLTQPPWKTVLDLGPTVLPREVVAVGFDANGKEIARASQILNLPRPEAEVHILLERDAEGRPARVALEGRHISYVQPRRAKVQLDGVSLSLDRHQRASLPLLDLKRPHVVSAEMTFEGGTVARREIVFGGEFSETVPTELTPVAVVPTSATDAPPNDGCFVANGTPLRVSLVEKPAAVLLVVRDPDPYETRRGLKAPIILGGRAASDVLRRSAPVSATMELVLSVPDRFRAADQPTAFIFPRLVSRNPREGLYAFLTSVHSTPGSYGGPRRWADAVAVAAVQAVSVGRRRAVILVLGSATDASQNSPAGVRKYLDAIGVPLFVWSVRGPRPDLTDSWGEVEDVSSREKIEHATALVNRALDNQRIAWVYADPITALHARVKDGCGYASLARP